VSERCESLSLIHRRYTQYLCDQPCRPVAAAARPTTCTHRYMLRPGVRLQMRSVEAPSVCASAIAYPGPRGALCGRHNFQVVYGSISHTVCQCPSNSETWESQCRCRAEQSLPLHPAINGRCQVATEDLVRPAPRANDSINGVPQTVW
jgi:hypothetical protein